MSDERIECVIAPFYSSYATIALKGRIVSWCVKKGTMGYVNGSNIDLCLRQF